MMSCPTGWYSSDEVYFTLCCPCSSCIYDGKPVLVNDECFKMSQNDIIKTENICYSLAKDCIVPEKSQANEKRTEYIGSETQPNLSASFYQDAHTKTLLIIAISIIVLVAFIGFGLLLFFKRKTFYTRRSTPQFHSISKSSDESSDVTEDKVEMIDDSVVVQTIICENQDMIKYDSKESEDVTTTTVLQNTISNETTNVEDVIVEQKQNNIWYSDDTTISKSSLPSLSAPPTNPITSITNPIKSSNTISENNQKVFLTSSNIDYKADVDDEDDSNKSPLSSNHKNSAVQRSSENSCKLEINGNYNSLYFCGKTGEYFPKNLTDLNRCHHFHSSSTSSSKNEDTSKVTSQKTIEETEDQSDILRSTVPLLASTQNTLPTEPSRFELLGLSRHQKLECGSSDED